MINREEALVLLNKYLKDEKLLKHSIAVEAIMKALARRLGMNENKWGLTGLLHDLDYEYTKEKPHLHGVTSAEILQDLLPEESIEAIKSHNYLHTQRLPLTELDKALLAADAVSGLIIAITLVMPNKKLSEVKIDTLRTKFKDNSFAKGCNRERIKLCEDLGLSIEEFLSISLEALKEESDKLGL